MDMPKVRRLLECLMYDNINDRSHAMYTIGKVFQHIKVLLFPKTLLF